MASPKPKPTVLKILEGNPGQRPLNKNEPKPERDLPPCPDYLAEDEYTKTEWDRIVPELYRLGLLTIVDRTALELYCSQYSIYKKAIIEIQESGLTTTNIRNGEKALPQLQIAREAAKIIKSIATEFGFTPSSRGRMRLPGDPEDEDPMDKWFKDKGK